MPASPSSARKRKSARRASPLVPVEVGSILFPSLPGPFRNLTKTVLRADDLLSLRFEFINLKRAKNAEGDEVLVRRSETALAYVVVHFAPQNIAEEAFFEVAQHYPVQDAPNKPPEPDKNTGNEEPTPPPVRSRIAGPSRLVFAVPAEEDEIPYTLDALLERIGRYEMSVAPVALPPPSLPKPNKFIVVGPIKSFVLTQALNRSATAVGTSLSSPHALEEVFAASQALQVQRASITAKRAALTAYDEVSKQVGQYLDSILIVPPKIALPRTTETAIELPYRLIVSPNKFGVWFHAKDPVRSAETGRTELWHTRLGTRLSPTEATEEDHRLRAIRAIWSRDPEFSPTVPGAVPTHANEPFRMSLDRFDRHQIVHLSSNFTIITPKLGNQPRKKYTPLPIDVDNLMLSALGAWLNSRGAWLPPRLNETQALSVEEWRHRGTMGRDHYVRVVYQGYLFPFGHRASLIKVTERKFHRKVIGNRAESIAYLRQRMYIVVRQPEKLFGDTGLKTSGGASYDLQFPFTRVRLTTLVTPDLDNPSVSDLQVNGADQLQSLFWPRVGGADFLFHLIAEDLDGHEIEFTAPLMFVDRSIGFGPDACTAAQTNYATNTANQPVLDRNRRFRSLKGQKVAFADSSAPGNTSFEVDELEFGAEVPLSGLESALGADHPRFYPAVRSAKVKVPAIKTLANNTQLPQITFEPEYLKKGFAGNPGEVFAKLVNANEFQMKFSDKGDRSGGLVQPDMTITGLSRTMGAVAGNLNNFVQGAGAFDPKNFFASLSPLMFGCVKLTDILAAVGLDVLDLVPKFITEQLTAAQSLLNDLQRLQQLVTALKGQAAALQAKTDAIASDALAIGGDISDLLDDPLGSTANLTQHLQDLRDDVNDLLAEFGGPNVSTVDRGLLKDTEQALTRFQTELDNVNKYVELLQTALQLPEELRVKFEWKPKLQNWGIDPSHPIVIFNNKNGLVIAVEVRAKSNLSDSPKATVLCRLEDFALDLIAPASFIRLNFERVEFFMLVGKKPDIDVKFKGFEFVGVLSFVEALRTLIPLDGFSDPPSLTVSEKGIAAQFDIALPNISIGVFALSNMAFGAGFTVPFIGDPLSVRFNFCSRESPFTLQVWLFGGGGFFALTLDPHGVQIFEAAFEFGATVSVDFGVASGGVYVMAGIYFKIMADEAELTGYFRMGGHVSVLGIVSVSIELYLELRYEFASGKCVGKAVLTIEVELFFFSISVQIQCERKFAGSNGDPTFAQMIEPPVWTEYCDAFA
jgi:hypothetical protein